MSVLPGHPTRVIVMFGTRDGFGDVGIRVTRGPVAVYVQFHIYNTLLLVDVLHH